MGGDAGADPSDLLTLRHIQVTYGGRTVLDVPALAVRSGEVLAVIGPNGAGKSTLLRVLALLDRPNRGTVLVRGLPVDTESQRLALRRRMASVFQDALLCDVSVAANVRLPLTFRGIGRATADRRIRPWLERLGIAHLADRSARSLSGGEAQRASLARALATAPEVLFLDEPFAALDPPTRDALLDDLGGILGDGQATTVFVTHDRSEAMRLGDRIGVMLDGRVAQVGRPEEVFGAPVNEAVARLVGVENLLPGRVVALRDGLVEVAVPGLTVAVAGRARVGDRALVALRPEDVLLEPAGASGPTSAQNRFQGRVIQIVPMGPLYRVGVDCGPRLTAMVTRPAVRTLGLVPGSPVGVSFKATAAHLIRPTPPALTGS